MAVSPVQIVNLALSRVGQSKPIVSMTDGSAAASVANGCFDILRDATLCGAWWPFARKDAALSRLGGVERAGWIYSYALPVDCLAPRALWQDDGGTGLSSFVAFELQADDGGSGGSILCTSQRDARLVYTRTIQHVASLSADFVDAFAWRLAADLALGLSKKPDVAAGMMTAYQSTISKVRARFYNAERRVPQPSSFELVRGNGTALWER